MKKKIICCLLPVILTGCNYNQNNQTDGDNSYATSTPYGRYNDTIYYTLANETSANNSNMPLGDTYENNAYTRYLKEFLNIQNIDILEATDSDYNNNIDLMISQNNLPDIFMISSQEQLNYLVEHDMIANLTDSYYNCTTSTIKDIYASYSNDIIGSVTIDNEIWALPGLNIDDGPNLFWLRQDWLDQLGLLPPENIYDIENIVTQFVNGDLDANGVNDTVGIVLSKNIAGENGASAQYLLDTYFSAFDSFPKQWLDSGSKLEYGSLTKETKTALDYISTLYSRNIIDQNFMLRSENNIKDLIIDGQCGSFFGPWWSPNDPLSEALTKDPSANWVPYLIKTSGDVTAYHTTSPINKYIVASKDFEHPEIIFKIASVIFDYTRFQTDKATEINNYFALNVDPTARPLSINIDFQDALVKTSANIVRGLNKEVKKENLSALEQSYLVTISNYLNGPFDPLGWSAYTSRIKAIELFTTKTLAPKNTGYSGNYGPFAKTKNELDQYEQDTFIKIISGYESIDYFDKFVEEYMINGGQTVIDYVNSQKK